MNTKDGRLILVDFLLVSTVARVDVLCGAVAWSFTQGLRDQQYSQIIIFGWWIKSGWKTWVLDICRESATQSQEKKDPKPQGGSRGMAYIEERLSGATRHRWNTSGQKGGKKTVFQSLNAQRTILKCGAFLIVQYCSTCLVIGIPAACVTSHISSFPAHETRRYFNCRNRLCFQTQTNTAAKGERTKTSFIFTPLSSDVWAHQAKSKRPTTICCGGRARETAPRGVCRLPGPGETPFTGDASSWSFNVAYRSPVLQLVSQAVFECSNVTQRGNDCINGGNGAHDRLAADAFDFQVSGALPVKADK